MKTLNHSEGQDFYSWPPKSIVGALSIQIHVFTCNLYNEHYLHMGCKMHKNIPFITFFFF